MSFKIENGVIVKYEGSETDVIIPDGVHTISKDAFSYTPITSVTIPGSVKRIERTAFCNTRHLKRINLEDIMCFLDEGLVWPLFSLTEPATSPDIYIDGVLAEEIVVPNGVKTIGDLAKANRDLIIKKFGKFGQTMLNYANGIDDSIVNSAIEDPKSISNEVTLPNDVNNIEELNKLLVALAEQVSYRLRKHGLVANTVGVNLKTKDFKNYSHQKTLNYSTSSTKEILNTAKQVLIEMYKKEPIRLIGVKVDNLENKDEIQISFFENDKKQEKLDSVLDDLKIKYGYNSITRAGKLDINNIVKDKDKKMKE